MNNNTVITISREYGSGGRIIGKMVAEKLGIPFYDNEIITMSAEESGINAEYFKEAENMAKSSISLSISMLYPSTEVYGMPLNEKIFITQSRVIREVAEEGPCVIVGRCADYVLRSNPNAINVFVHSSMVNRIKRVREVYGDTAHENLESIIKKADKRRANYYAYFTDRKWGDARNYTLCLDSDKLGLENCADIIIEAIKKREEYNKA